VSEEWLGFVPGAMLSSEKKELKYAEKCEVELKGNCVFIGALFVDGDLSEDLKLLTFLWICSSLFGASIEILKLLWNFQSTFEAS
jgi:hypothetical protein